MFSMFKATPTIDRLDMTVAAEAAVSRSEPEIVAVKERLPRIDALPAGLQFPDIKPVSDVAKQAAKVLGHKAAFYQETNRVAAEAAPAQKYADECVLFEALVDIGVRPFQFGAVRAYKNKMLAAMGPVTVREPDMDNVVLDKNSGNWWRWNRYAVGEYRNVIPEGVLSVALAVKERLPDVTLIVDALELERRGDEPFLVAHLGLAEFYIAVWDEPSFTAKYE